MHPDTWQNVVFNENVHLLLSQIPDEVVSDGYILPPPVFAYRMRTPDTAYASDSRNIYITGFFSSQRVYQPNSPNIQQNFHMLAENIDMIIKQSFNSFAVITNDMQTEHTERNQADVNLQGNINKESNARSVADSNLQNNINKAINDYRASISSNVTNLQNNINANTNAIRSISKPDLSPVYKSISDNVSSLQNNINRLTNEFNSSVSNLQRNINANSNAINNLQKNGVNVDLTPLNEFKNSATSQLNALTLSTTALTTTVNSLKNDVKSNSDNVNKLTTQLSNVATALNANVDSVNDLNVRHKRDIDSLNSRIDSLNSNFSTFDDSNILKKLDELKPPRQFYSEVSSALTRVLPTYIDVLSQFVQTEIVDKLDSIKKSIDDSRFTFSDGAIILAIKELKSPLDSLKDILNNFYTSFDNFKLMFNVGSFDFNESTLDGGLTRLLKFCFKNLINTINNLSKSVDKNFSDLSKKLDTFFDIKNETSSWSLFGAVLDDRLKIIQNKLDLLVMFKDVLHDWLDTININLINILNKLDTLSFNNISNYIDNAPKDNFWSVLKTLIEKLSDLILNLSDKIIHLLVPENLNFLDNRTQDLSTKFKNKFSFAFAWIDLFKSSFKNQESIKDIPISVNLFDKGVSFNIPLSALNSMATFVRPFITGLLLLSYLIDCYGWFYRRGAVLNDN